MYYLFAGQLVHVLRLLAISMRYMNTKNMKNMMKIGDMKNEKEYLQED
jgi:hypothetical protein